MSEDLCRRCKGTMRGMEYWGFNHGWCKIHEKCIPICLEEFPEDDGHKDYVRFLRELQEKRPNAYIWTPKGY